MPKTKLIPGFRFHPTDVELLKYYLKRKVMGKKFYNDAIAEVDIYKYAPWDLPDKSCLKTGDLEWYFFCPRGKKYGSGVRMNRATEVGYWKTTGRDRAVQHNNEIAGMIKTLVFHIGKAPRGDRTDWVMYEYRLEDKELTDKGIPQDSYVICKVFQKEGPGPRNGAQYGRPFNEEDWDDEEVEIPFTALSAPLPILPMTSHSSVPNDKHPPASGCIGSTSMSCLSGSMPSPGPVPNDKHLPASGCIGSSSMSCLSGSMPSPGPVPKDKHLPTSGCIGSTSMSCLSGSMPSPGPANLSDPSEQAVNNDDDILSMLEFFKEDNSLLEKVYNTGQENIAEGAPLSDFFEGLEDLDNWADFGAFSSGQNAEYSTNGMVTTGDVSGFGDLEFLELIDLDSPLWQTTQPKSWSQR